MANGKSKFGTPQTEEERLQAEMADLEFEAYIGAEASPVVRPAIDADRARVIDSPELLPLKKNVDGQWLDTTSSVEGFYTNPLVFDPTDPMSRYANYTEAEQELLEPDTVYAGWGGGARNPVWRHEFLHRAEPNLKEGHLRLWDIFRASGKDDVNEAFEQGEWYSGLSKDELKETLAESVPDMIEMEAKAAMEQQIAVPNLPDNEYDEELKMEAYRDFYTERALYRHPWLADYGIE